MAKFIGWILGLALGIIGASCMCSCAVHKPGEIPRLPAIYALPEAGAVIDVTIGHCMGYTGYAFTWENRVELTESGANRAGVVAHEFGQLAAARSAVSIERVGYLAGGVKVGHPLKADAPFVGPRGELFLGLEATAGNGRCLPCRLAG